MKIRSAAIAVIVALIMAASADAETWKASNRFPASIDTPRQVCRYMRAEAHAIAATHDVRVRKFTCNTYPRHGKWSPIDAYVRMSGRVIDQRGNPYTSRYVSLMVDFRRHFVRIWGSDEV